MIGYITGIVHGIFLSALLMNLFEKHTAMYKKGFEDGKKSQKIKEIR